MYKYLLFIFTLICVIFSYVYVIEPYIKLKDLHQKLYDMWDKLKPILEKHEINYFADGGSLLGAYRERKIIGHDDDIDIGIMQEDVNKLFSQEFLKDLELSNLMFDSNRYVWKFFPTDNLNEIFIDVFVYTIKDDKVHFVCPKQRKQWPNAYYFYDELFPLTTYDFGNSTIKGANNPVKYFVRQYGKNWMTPIKSHSHHQISKEDFKK